MAKGKGKKASKALEAMNELQRSIASLDLEEARKLMEQQKQAMADMQVAQKEAQRAVIQARVELARSKQEHKGKDEYGDENFWEKRYQEESEKCRDKEGDIDTYEWYLTFEQMRPLLARDLDTALRRASADACKIVVSGCGNSTLCEDLHAAGYRNVSGNDYSTSVIGAMQKRSSSHSEIEYYVGDARDLAPVGVGPATHVAVVDKGTLDAIASAGGSDGGVDAAAYLAECNRVLNVHGVLLLVTTMTHTVLKQLLDLSLQKDRWALDAHDAMKTPEGTDVSYFCLRKRNLASTIAAVPAVSVEQGTGAQESDDVKERIRQIVAEVRAAGDAAASARSQLAERQENVKTALRDLEDSTRERERLAKKLDSMDVSREMQEAAADEAKAQAGELPPGPLVGKGLGEKAIANAQEVSTGPPPEPPTSSELPIVSVVVSLDKDGVGGEDDGDEEEEEEDRLLVPSESRLTVTYTLKGQDGCAARRDQWDYEDTLALICVRDDCDTVGTGGTHAQTPDALEYSVRPCAQTGVGRITLTLPRGAALYRVAYVRATIALREEEVSVSDPAADRTGGVTTTTKTVAERSYQVLALSAVVAATGVIYSHASTALGKPRRRGGLSEGYVRANTGILVWAEDCRGLSQLAVTATPLDGTGGDGEGEGEGGPGVSRVLTRVRAWLEPTSHRLLVEADLLATSPHLDAPHVRTVYGSVELSPDYALNLDLHPQVTVHEGRVHMCLPYTAMSGHTATAVRNAPEPQQTVLSENPKAVELACSFCRGALVPSGVIDRVTALPSGAFDHVMSDMVCCERPTLPMSSGSIVPRNAELLVNSTFAACTPAQLACDLEASCKSHPSFLDLVTNVTLARATATSAAADGAKGRVSHAIVDMSTCALHCSRCMSYIGDGVVKEEDIPGAGWASTTGKERENGKGKDGSMEESWSMADLSCVRLAWHRVSLGGSFVGAVCEPEQALARAVLRLADLSGLYCLIVTPSSTPSASALVIRFAARPSVLLVDACARKALRLPDRDTHTEPLPTWILRVSFSESSGGEVKRGLPLSLEDDEWDDVRAVLQARAQLIGMSIFKGQAISWLRC